MLTLRTPYLLFLGDAQDRVSIKTALGVRDWARDHVVAEWGLPDCTVSTGVRAVNPAEAVALGAKSLLIGVAPDGGALPRHWIPALRSALSAGLDLVSGLHDRLDAIPALRDDAARHGRRLTDLRSGDWQPRIASGKPRSGRRLLTVGTDCALGKKYTALALAKAMRARGVDADFRATGQTGIVIAGGGIAIDAVKADFIAGAAEAISPANDDDHWDVIEGQGSLWHPCYAGVSLGLLHGAQAHALVLCHDPSRHAVDGFPDYPLPGLDEAIDLNVRLARRTNPKARCVGISFNTSTLDEAQARELLQDATARHGLPCIDPVRFGADAIVDEALS